MSLNLVDKRLLYLLDQNCRQSTTQLAKQLRVHRNVVLYRLKRLEDSGVIRGYFTEVDIMKIGYVSFRVLLKLSNFTVDEEKEMVDYLMSVGQLMWFFKTEGKYDIDIVYACKSNTEFNSLLIELKTKFNRIIEEEKTSTLLQIQHFTKDYFVNMKREDIKTKKFEDKTIVIDEKDKKILSSLSNNARMNIIDIAKKTQLSVNTVKDRLKVLGKEKIILGYKPFIDTEKTGYTYYKIFINLKNYMHQDYLKIYAFFEYNMNVIYLTKYLNGDDMEVEIHLENDRKLSEFKGVIMEKFGKIIKEMYSLRFIHEYIYKYLPEKM